MASVSPNQEQELLFEKYMVEVIGLVFAGAITLIVWEYFLNLFAEIEIHRKRKYSIAVILLLIVRYSTLAAVGAALPYVYGNPPNCVAAGYIVQVAFWIMNTSVQSIFYLRTCAICNWTNSVRIGLGVATLATSACWFASIFTYEGRNDIPDILYGGKCFQGQGERSWKAVSYISSCVFDFIVLSITIYKVWSTSGKKLEHLFRPPTEQRTSALLLWQSIAYFFPVFCANFSGAIISLAAADSATRSVSISYTFAVSSVAASRMVFHMRDHLGRQGDMRPKANLADKIQTTSPMVMTSPPRNASLTKVAATAGWLRDRDVEASQQFSDEYSLRYLSSSSHSSPRF